MTTLVFVMGLVAFLAMLPRRRDESPSALSERSESKGPYSPAMVLLLVYVFLEYARPQTMHPELDVVPWAKLTMAALLGGVLFGAARHEASHPPARRQNALLFAYLGAAALSIVAGIDPSSSMEVFVNLVKLVLFYYVLSRVLITRMRVNIFIWMLLIIHVKLALHHVRAFVSEADYVGIETAIHRGRSVGNGFLGNAGDFGVALCVVLPLALFVVWTEQRRLLRWLAVASLLAFIAGICSTGSRGAFVALMAIGMGTWLKTQRKAAALATLACLLAAGLAVAPEAYWKRMSTIVGGTSTAGTHDPAQGTKRTRIELWKAGLAMAFEHPIAGVGIGNFGEALDRTVRNASGVDFDRETRFLRRQLRRGALAPHNMFIQALSEVGFIGLVLILWCFTASIARHRSIRRMSTELGEDGQFTFWLAHALDLCLIGLAVSGSFLTVLYYPHLWVILGVSVAVSNSVLTACTAAEHAQAEIPGGRRHVLEPARVA